MSDENIRKEKKMRPKRKELMWQMIDIAYSIGGQLNHADTCGGQGLVA
jgi:hypothetical protein